MLLLDVRSSNFSPFLLIWSNISLRLTFTPSQRNSEKTEIFQTRVCYWWLNIIFHQLPVRSPHTNMSVLRKNISILESKADKIASHNVPFIILTRPCSECQVPELDISCDPFLCENVLVKKWSWRLLNCNYDERLRSEVVHTFAGRAISMVWTMECQGVSGEPTV